VTETMSYEGAFQCIEHLLVSECSVGAGMASLVDYCSKQVPNDLWDRVREIDFEKDAANFREWLERVLSLEPPPDKIEAFWFGLFDAGLEDGRESCILYLSGAVRFGPESDSADWACETPDSYLAEEQYADSAALDLIDQAVQGTEVASFAKWSLCLGYASFTVRHICQALDPTLLVGHRASRGVAVGWDDGDWIALGVVGMNGWKTTVVRDGVL
jgi:hypothetical protein